MALRVHGRLSMQDGLEEGKGHVKFIIKEGASQIAHRRFSDWDAGGRASVISKT